MTSRLSDTLATPVDGQLATKPLKIVIAGGFAVGKTTFVDSISEITPLTTEAPMTTAALGIDDAALVESKTTTTVAMDFGRITIDRDLVLYLFGTPGQDRFDFMWEILGEGMLGYVLLVDATRPDSLEEAVGILEAFRKMAHVPFVVGLNRADGGIDEGEERRVREVLELDSHVPVVPCDATDRESVKAVLLALLYAVVETLDGATAAQA
jgi:small GTP-binding protein